MDSNIQFMISELRDQLVNEFHLRPNRYDRCDLDRVIADDWTVKRFLLAAKLDINCAFVLANNAMHWRKIYGINTVSDIDFPLEFYRAGVLFPYCEDRGGKAVIYFRLKLYKHFPHISVYFRQFMIHLFNKIDIQSGETGWAMVWDVSDAGPSNWDLSMVSFVLSSLRNYFPHGMTYLLVYGIPRIMNPFVNISLKLLPEESKQKVKTVSTDGLLKFIDTANLPDFMGGKSTKEYKEIPKGARNAIHVATERGYTLREIDNVLHFYEKYL